MEQAAVCANRYTRALTGPLANGRRPPNTVAVALLAAGPVTLCVNRYTGKLRYSATGACTTSEVAGVFPG